MAQRTGLSRRTTQRQLAKLEAANVACRQPWHGITVRWKLTAKGRTLADGSWARLPDNWRTRIRRGGHQHAWLDIAIFAACYKRPKKVDQDAWYCVYRVAHRIGCRPDHVRRRLQAETLPAKLVELLSPQSDAQAEEPDSPKRRTERPKAAQVPSQSDAPNVPKRRTNISSNTSSNRRGLEEKEEYTNATATAPPSAEGCGASGGSREGGTKGANSDQRLTGTDTVAFLQAKAKAESQAKEVPA